jgi:hypothetical protein
MIVPPRRRVGSSILVIAVMVMIVAIIYLAFSTRNVKSPPMTPIQQLH